MDEQMNRPGRGLVRTLLPGCAQGPVALAGSFVRE
jgi:hypothetical protein